MREGRYVAAGGAETVFCAGVGPGWAFEDLNEQSPPVPWLFDELGWEPRRPTKRTPARLASEPARGVVGRRQVRDARECDGRWGRR